MGGNPHLKNLDNKKNLNPQIKENLGEGLFLLVSISILLPCIILSKKKFGTGPQSFNFLNVRKIVLREKVLGGHPPAPPPSTPIHVRGKGSHERQLMTHSMLLY